MKNAVFFLWSLLVLPFSLLLAEKNLGIFTMQAQGVAPWDPDSVQSGIAGSEEAVIYMSQHLARLGYKVTVFGNPPKDSPYTSIESNPRFVSSADPVQERLDIAIAWRMPGIGKALKTVASTVYLWPHDVRGSYPLSAEEIQSFDDVLWLSQWQKEEWSSKNPEFSQFNHIFGNGINPEQFNPVQKRKNPYACIYASNYSRGLEELLRIWPKVKKQFPKATLDLYYGWNHWGTLTPEKEAFLRKSVEELSSFDVKEHGMVSHKELAEAFQKASLWTYPCTAPETFCITALKAQLAGAIPVVLQHSGLHETVQHGFICHDLSEYESLLIQALKKAPSISLKERKKMGEFILEHFQWKKIAEKWSTLFNAKSPSSVGPCLPSLTLVLEATKSPLEALQGIAPLKNQIKSWVVTYKEMNHEDKKKIEKELEGIPGTFLDLSKTSKECLSSLIKKTSTDYTLVVDAKDPLYFLPGSCLKKLEHDAYCVASNPGRRILLKNALEWKWAEQVSEPFSSQAQTLSAIAGIIPESLLKKSFPLTEDLSQDPRLKELLVQFHAAQSFIETKEYELALALHHQIIQAAHPKMPLYSSWYYMGILNELLNKEFEDVLDCYSKAAMCNPDRVEPLFRLSVYSLSKGNYAIAYSIAKQALNSPKKAANTAEESWIYEYGIQFALGNAAFMMGKYLEAKTAYESLLSVPNLPQNVQAEIKDNLKKTLSLIKL